VRRLLDTRQGLRVLRMIYLYLALLPIILVSLYGITVKDEGYGQTDALD
jgi:hypothetical protein